MISYMLTSAVSLTAAVEAIASAFPALWSFRIWLVLFLLLLLTILNLRWFTRDRYDNVYTGISFPIHLFTHAGLWSHPVFH